MFRWLMRMHRTGFLSTTAIGVVAGIITTWSFPVVAGHTPASRLLWGHELIVTAQATSWLIPVPFGPATLGGFLDWKLYGFLCILYPFWAINAASGAVRGDEERRLIPVWLHCGLTRTSYLFQRIRAYLVVSAVSIACTGLAVWLTSFTTGTPLSLPAVAGVSVALAALTLCSYGVALLIGQEFAASHLTTGVAGALFLLLFFLASLGRLNPSVSWFTNVSPFGLYYQTTALAGGAFDLAGVVALCAVFVLSSFGATRLFRIRDEGAAAFKRINRKTEVVRSTSSLRPSVPMTVPALRGLVIHKTGLTVWIAALIAGMLLIVNVSHATVTLFHDNAAFSNYLHGSGVTGGSVLSSIGFGIMELLLSIYVVTQVSDWSLEEQNGILALKLTQPRSREGIVAERFATLTLSVALLTFIPMTCMYAVGRLTGVSIDATHFFLAALLLIPFAMTFGCVGGALVSIYPRSTLVVLSAYAVISYFLFSFTSIFRWPGWIANMSVYSLYGTPYASSVALDGLAAMLAICAIGIFLAMMGMHERSVAA